MNGWIKLHNKFLNWEWYDKTNMVHLFVRFLLNANFKKNNWHGQEILPGQLIIGLYKLSEQTGISIQSLRTCLARLKSTNEITIKSTNKYSVITIVNWAKYQGREEKSTSKSTSNLTNNQQTTNKQLTTLEEDKTIISKEEESRFAPPSLIEVEEYCKERRNSINPNNFIDFYSSKGWLIGKNKMKDWRAAVRTWEQRSGAEQRPLSEEERLWGKKLN